MNTPIIYKYNDNLMTEEEAVAMIERRLGESCGDIMSDIEYLQSLDKLHGIHYSPERRARIRYSQNRGI